MRIVSYNIMGGEGRADPLAEVLIAQRPDIVTLVEADNLAVVERLANRLRMDFIHGVGNQHASAILSRWTIRETVNHAPLRPTFSRSLLEATIVDPAGAEWIVAALHLYPYHAEADEQRRETELAELLDIYAPLRQANRAHLLAGDFNANSPHQKIDITKCRPNTRKNWHDNGGDLPRRVIQKLMDVGYVETMHAVNSDLAAHGVTFTTHHPGQRLDYIFAHGIDPSRFHSVWIETDRLATYASDHYPIGLEME